MLTWASVLFTKRFALRFALIVLTETGSAGRADGGAVGSVDEERENVVEIANELGVLLGGEHVLDGDPVAVGHEVELEYGGVKGCGAGKGGQVGVAWRPLTSPAWRGAVRLVVGADDPGRRSGGENDAPFEADDAGAAAERSPRRVSAGEDDV